MIQTTTGRMVFAALVPDTESVEPASRSPTLDRGLPRTTALPCLATMASEPAPGRRGHPVGRGCRPTSWAPSINRRHSSRSAVDPCCPWPPPPPPHPRGGPPRGHGACRLGGLRRGVRRVLWSAHDDRDRRLEPTGLRARRARRRLIPTAEVVVIHDAARPFASPDLFTAVIEAVDEDGRGRDPGDPGRPTRSSGSRTAWSSTTLDREELGLAQTPQAFAASLLRAAHRRADEAGQAFTDDAAVMEHAGHRVRAIAGGSDEHQDHDLVRPGPGRGADERRRWLSA